MKRICIVLSALPLLLGACSKDWCNAAPSAFCLNHGSNNSNVYFSLGARVNIHQGETISLPIKFDLSTIPASVPLKWIKANAEAQKVNDPNVIAILSADVTVKAIANPFTVDSNSLTKLTITATENAVLGDRDGLDLPVTRTDVSAVNGGGYLYITVLPKQ